MFEFSGHPLQMDTTGRLKANRRPEAPVPGHVLPTGVRPWRNVQHIGRSQPRQWLGVRTHNIASRILAAMAPFTRAAKLALHLN
jgi:hypothetical protein